jgi:hypothetical protein
MVLSGVTILVKRNRSVSDAVDLVTEDFGVMQKCWAAATGGA